MLLPVYAQCVQSMSKNKKESAKLIVSLVYGVHYEGTTKVEGKIESLH